MAGSPAADVPALASRSGCEQRCASAHDLRDRPAAPRSAACTNLDVPGGMPDADAATCLAEYASRGPRYSRPEPGQQARPSSVPRSQTISAARPSSIAIRCISIWIRTIARGAALRPVIVGWRGNRPRHRMLAASGSTTTCRHRSRWTTSSSAVLPAPGLPVTTISLGRWLRMQLQDDGTDQRSSPAGGLGITARPALRVPRALEVRSGDHGPRRGRRTQGLRPAGHACSACAGGRRATRRSRWTIGAARHAPCSAQLRSKHQEPRPP
jgi:hypothetical protein